MICFMEIPYQENTQKWLKGNEALARRIDQVKGWISLAQAYAEEPNPIPQFRNLYPTKGLELAKRRAINKQPIVYGLFQEFKRIRLAREKEQIKREFDAKSMSESSSKRPDWSKLRKLAGVDQPSAQAKQPSDKNTQQTLNKPAPGMRRGRDDDFDIEM